MDQQVRLVCGHAGHLAGRGVPDDDELAAAAPLAHHLRGLHPVHRLAALQPAEVRPGLHTQLAGASLVEAPGTVLLDERVAVCGHAVLHREGGDRVAVALERRGWARAPTRSSGNGVRPITGRN